MPFEIILAPEAADDLVGLKANLRAEVREGIETHLRHEPQKVSRIRSLPLYSCGYVDAQGVTPLFAAAGNGYFEVLRLLVDAGAMSVAPIPPASPP